MSLELLALLACFLTLLASLLAQALYLDLKAGLRYAFSSRDQPEPHMSPLKGRLDRNLRNQVEGMALLLPLVVIVELAGLSSALTAYGAVLYAVTRPLFALAYILDWVPWRTVIWLIGLASLLVMFAGLATQALNG